MMRGVGGVKKSIHQLTGQRVKGRVRVTMLMF